mgnify:CR=1 FL=1
MKPEDFVCDWVEKKFGGGKELGDWTTNEVMQFASDYADERLKYVVNNKDILRECSCEIYDAVEVKVCLDCFGVVH